MLNDVYHTTLAPVSACTRHFIFHTMHGERLIVCCISFPLCFLRVSLLHFALLFPLLLVVCLEPSSMWTMQRQTLLAPPLIKEFCSLGEHTPPTGYEPKLLDDFHYSESIEMILQEESGGKDTVLSYLCDAEFDDEKHRESAVFTTSGPKTSFSL